MQESTHYLLEVQSGSIGYYQNSSQPTHSLGWQNDIHNDFVRSQLLSGIQKGKFMDSRRATIGLPVSSSRRTIQAHLSDLRARACLDRSIIHRYNCPVQSMPTLIFQWIRAGRLSSRKLYIETLQFLLGEVNF